MGNVETGRHYGENSNPSQAENNLASDLEGTRTAPRKTSPFCPSYPILGMKRLHLPRIQKKKKSSCMDKATEIERKKASLRKV